MKEHVLVKSNSSTFTNFLNKYNNDDCSTVTNGLNIAIRYPIFSTNWISTISEELNICPLPDVVLNRVAEDASYRLREILQKCVTHLRHCRKKCLTSADVNDVLLSLYDSDSIIGISEKILEYVLDAQVFIFHERAVDVKNKVYKSSNFSQNNAVYLQEAELTNSQVMEAENSYSKWVLKLLFNGSQQAFEAFLQDYATNTYFGDSVVEKLLSIARSLLISNNAQYTRVSTRTCQLVIAITNNVETGLPYHLTCVDRLTELLLDLLLGEGFINSNLQPLFKDCALKLMLRWPSVADRFLPVLKNVLLKNGDNSAIKKKQMISIELLFGIQPLIFLLKDIDESVSFMSVLKHAELGSPIWQKIATAVYAFIKTGKQLLDYAVLSSHFGDSILPYLLDAISAETVIPKNLLQYRKENAIFHFKTRRVPIMTTKKYDNYNIMQTAFPKFEFGCVRREMRFAFAGCRPIPQNHLRRASLRADYQILRSERKASYAQVAMHRLFVCKRNCQRTSTLLSLQL